MIISSSAVPPVYKIGVFTYSGANNDFEAALQIGLEEVNRIYAGNFSIEIEFAYENSTYATYNAAYLWNQNGFMGSIGPMSSDGCYTVFLSLPQFPVISPTASVPYGPPVFQLMPTAYMEISALTQLIDYYSWNIFVFLYSDDAYGRVGYVEFGSHFRGKVASGNVRLIKVDPSTLRSELQNASDSAFRVFICFASPAPTRTILNTARDLGYMSKGYAWALGSGSEVDDLSIYTSDFYGLITAVPNPGRGPMYNHFEQKFAAKTGREPDHVYSSAVYDSVLVFGSALSQYTTAPNKNLTYYLSSSTFNTTKERYFSFSSFNSTRILIRNLRKGGFQEIATWNTSMTTMPPLKNVIFPGNTSDIPGRVIRIAWIGPLSEKNNVKGRELLNSSLLALQEINGERTNKSFLPSVRFELVAKDTRSRVVDTLSVLNEVLNDGVQPIAVCGAENSIISEGVQITLSFYKIPQISPESTSDTLSDKASYPYFVRGCAPDNKQIKALVALIKFYNWRKIGVISGTDLYGMNAHRIFSEEAGQQSIEIVTSIPFNSATTNQDLNNILEQFRNPYPLKIFVILAIQSDSRAILIDAQRRGLVGPDYVWLGLDSVMNIEFEEISVGLFSVAPSDGNWYDEIGPELQANKNNHFVGHWFDSILFIGHAVRNMINNDVHTLNGPNLFQAMRNTNFTGVTGEFYLNLTTYDRIQGSDIYNFQGTEWVKVFTYKHDNITATTSSIFYDGTSMAPRDTWTTWVAFSSGAGIFVVSINSFGLFLWFILTILVIHFRDDRVIKASSFKFLLLNSLGLLLGFITIFFFVGEPHTATCHLRYWLGCIAFVLVFGPLFTRTYRIYRLFQTVASTRIVVISNSTLYAYIGFMLACPILLLLIWASKDPLEVDPTGPNRDRFFTTKRCFSRDQQSYEVALYVMGGVMLLAGAILSFLARNAATAFNEAKWIGLSIYTLIVCALIAIPSSEALKNVPDIQVIILCSAVIVGLIGILLFIFGSKIYSIINSKVKETDEFLLQ